MLSLVVLNVFYSKNRECKTFWSFLHFFFTSNVNILDFGLKIGSGLCRKMVLDEKFCTTGGLHKVFL